MRQGMVARSCTPVVAAVVVVAALAACSSTSAPRSLPVTTPAELIKAVDASGTNTHFGYSGTVVADASPGLPDTGSAGGFADSRPNSPAFGISSILSGTHTMRFWYGGPERQRVAILRADSEADYFRDGKDVWVWDSASQQVSHTKATSGTNWNLPLTFATLTPQALARNVLDAADSRKDVTIAAQTVVADRPCYELIVRRPENVSSPVGEIRIGVDGLTKVPLSVQIFAQGGTSPAIDVSFTSITFVTPGDDYFHFTAPPSATWVPWAQSSVTP
jgi:outer membrane lipoprotein-sorting protein